MRGREEMKINRIKSILSTALISSVAMLISAVPANAQTSLGDIPLAGYIISPEEEIAMVLNYLLKWVFIPVAFIIVVVLIIKAIKRKGKKKGEKNTKTPKASKKKS